MSDRVHRPSPNPPRPPQPDPDEGDGKDAPDRMRQARLLLLKNRIRKGLYDVDSKIEGILDGIVSKGLA